MDRILVLFEEKYKVGHYLSLIALFFILNRTIQFLDMRRPAPSSTKWWLMMIVEFESRPRMVKNPNMTIARWISSGPIIEQLMVIVKSLLLLPFSHHFCPYSFLFALYFSSYSHFISWDKKKFLICTFLWFYLSAKIREMLELDTAPRKILKAAKEQGLVPKDLKSRAFSNHLTKEKVKIQMANVQGRD